MWYKTAIEKLDKDSIYTREQLLQALQNEKPGFSYNSLKWLIPQMLKDKIIYKKQRGLYTLSKSSELDKNEYVPKTSNSLKKITELIENKYDLIDFVCFESIQLNEFLNHQIVNNTYFIMVEKDCAESVFRYLQEEKVGNILFKPNKKEYDTYWGNESIILLNLISEAPIRNNHSISIEQLLVDIVSEKVFSYVFSESEIKRIYKNADKNYLIDYTKLLRYARRRGKEEEIKSILEII